MTQARDQKYCAMLSNTCQVEIVKHPSQVLNPIVPKENTTNTWVISFKIESQIGYLPLACELRPKFLKLTCVITPLKGDMNAKQFCSTYFWLHARAMMSAPWESLITYAPRVYKMLNLFSTSTSLDLFNPKLLRKPKDVGMWLIHTVSNLHCLSKTISGKN